MVPGCDTHKLHLHVNPDDLQGSEPNADGAQSLIRPSSPPSGQIAASQSIKELIQQDVIISIVTAMWIYVVF